MKDKTRFFDIISLGAAVVASLAAAFTVYQASSSYRLQMEASRPYFMSFLQGFKSDDASPSLPTPPPLQFTISLKNIGLRPAQHLRQSILSTDISLKGEKRQIDNFGPYNEIAPSELFTSFPDTTMILKKDDVPAQYFVIAIRYEDPMTEVPYYQTFVFKWTGVTKGKFYKELFFATEQEAHRVLLYMESELKEYTPKKPTEKPWWKFWGK